MDNPSFKDALTANETAQLERYPDETNVSALTALLRVEGALLVGPENLMRSKNDHGLLMIDERRQLRAPQKVHQKTEEVYSKLHGKYDWLEVKIDISPGNESGITFRIKDEEALLKHFETIKKSALLEAKLKRNMVELGNYQAGSASVKLLSFDSHGAPTSELVKASAWSDVITAVLQGSSLQDDTHNPRTGRRNKIVDVLKSMQADAPQVRDKVYSVLQTLDLSDAPPQVRRELEIYKADAAKVSNNPAQSTFASFFALIEDTGRTVQALIREREKEAMREKK